MTVLPLFVLTVALDRFASSAAMVDRLIQQLGSDHFTERQAASHSLDQLGVTVHRFM